MKAKQMTGVPKPIKILVAESFTLFMLGIYMVNVVDGLGLA